MDVMAVCVTEVVMDVMAVCVPLTEVMSWMSWLCVFP